MLRMMRGGDSMGLDPAQVANWSSDECRAYLIGVESGMRRQPRVDWQQLDAALEAIQGQLDYIRHTVSQHITS